jgi:hypothetical protein
MLKSSGRKGLRDPCWGLSHGSSMHAAFGRDHLYMSGAETFASSIEIQNEL